MLFKQIDQIGLVDQIGLTGLDNFTSSLVNSDQIVIDQIGWPNGREMLRDQMG